MTFAEILSLSLIDVPSYIAYTNTLDSATVADFVAWVGSLNLTK